MTFDEILDGFSFLDDWEDRYRYLIELGRDMPPFPDDARTAENKVQGCTSQVWLLTSLERAGNDTVLRFQGDSDSHLVRGLVAVVIALYSGKSAKDILATDAEATLGRLGLQEHLTPQRSNGFRSMVNRIRAEAERALVSG